LADLITVNLENLKGTPYDSIVCYPKPNADELDDRVRQLEMHGVTALEFSGKGSLLSVPILGKGNVGIVVVAHRYGQRVALKIRRIDADRQDLMNEARMLALANSAGVGPVLIEVSRNFLLMQLVEGSFLPEWLNATSDKTALRNVLGELIEECWKLDLTGVDHGELSKAPKHVIIDAFGKPWIVDFETSSEKRKPANVPAICQYLLMSGGPVSMRAVEVLGVRNREAMVAALRGYKREKTRDSLDQLVKACLY
jgi:putative serine/threonine protein kinase